MTAWLIGPCFFEIPIYRCPQEVHAREMEAEKRGWIPDAESYREMAPDSHRSMELYFEREVWYPWRYNEAVGWIALCGGEGEVQGDLFFVVAKRIVRPGTRRLRRRFRWVGNLFALRFSADCPSDEIFGEMVSQLEAIQKQKRYRKRHIDSEAFKQIGPFVDWRGLLGLDSGGKDEAQDGGIAWGSA